MTNFILEKMWDQMYPNWDREEIALTPTHYRIRAKESVELWHGLYTPQGELFHCHLCQSTDKWILDNENVFVCEHEPIWVGRGSIRQISSIATKLVGEVEPV